MKITIKPPHTFRPRGWSASRLDPSPTNAMDITRFETEAPAPSNFADEQQKSDDAIAGHKSESIFVVPSTRTAPRPA